MTMYDSDDEMEWSIHDLDHAPAPPRDAASRLSFTAASAANNRRHSSPRFSIGTGSNHSPNKNRRTMGSSTLSPRSRRLLSLDNSEPNAAVARDRLASGSSASRDRLFSLGSSNASLPKVKTGESFNSIPAAALPPPPFTSTLSFPHPLTDQLHRATSNKRVEFSRDLESNDFNDSINPYGYDLYDGQPERLSDNGSHNSSSINLQRFESEDDTMVREAASEDYSDRGGVEEEKHGHDTLMNRHENWEASSSTLQSYYNRQPTRSNESGIRSSNMYPEDETSGKGMIESVNSDIYQVPPVNDRYGKKPSFTAQNYRRRSNSIDGSEDSQNPRRNRLNSQDHSTAVSDAGDETINGNDEESVSGHEERHSRKAIIFMGFALPLWFSKRPSWSRIASFVVTRAPCFWCYGCRQASPTERTVLARLNTLCACIASFQVASFVWLLIVSFSPSIVSRQIDPKQGDSKNGLNVVIDDVNSRILEVVVNLWNVNSFVYILGAEAIVIVIAALFTIRTIRNVNLVGAICYLWSLMWLLPIEILFVIGLFDYFRVTDVWIKHWWRDPTMAWFRRAFCRPQETYNTLCTVPLLQNEAEWCLDLYNSTQCSAIRNEAQTNLGKFILSYYYFNAAWGLLLVCLLFLNVNRLESMITRPLIQKSRESNVPAWLALPTIGCLLIGAVYAFAESSGLNTRSNTEASWIGPLYMASGGLYLLVALLGWHISAFSILNTRDKRHKIIAITVFIILIVAICVLLTTIFSASITFSINLVDLPITNNERGKIACFVDQIGSCSNCQEGYFGSDRCPEWSITDVTRVIQTQAKGSATLSAIFMMYGVAALRFGFGLRRHVTMYQIDYV